MKLSALAFATTLLFAAPASAQEINDAQIAAIVVTANQVDIDAGNLAAKVASNAEVKKFANQMVTDHSGVNKAAIELVTRLSVKPLENSTSLSLKEGGRKNIEKLKGLTGAAFDKAYVDNEVAYHAEVLSAVDTVLIPSAKNTELKALLVKVRPAFVAHLEHARHIQAAVQVQTIVIDASAFKSDFLAVNAGDTVVWTNHDLFPHTVTAANGSFDSKEIPAGKSWKYTPKVKGTFDYKCSYHTTMTGVLKVR